MSFRTEWMNANPLTIELHLPGKYADHDGNVADDYCLILSNGDDIAFEGSLDAIESIGRQILAMVTHTRKNEGK